MSSGTAYYGKKETMLILGIRKLCEGPVMRNALILYRAVFARMEGSWLCVGKTRNPMVFVISVWQPCFTRFAPLSLEDVPERTITH